MVKVLTLFVFATCVFAGDDPFLGTWKCNFERSSTTVANPPPQPVSMTLRYVAQGSGFQITGEAVTADGQKRTTARFVIFDGEEHPQTPDSPPGDIVIYRRSGRNAEEIVYKREGKVTTKISRVVSEDGKTLTYTSDSISDSGAPNKTVIVYEKQ